MYLSCSYDLIHLIYSESNCTSVALNALPPFCSTHVPVYSSCENIYFRSYTMNTFSHGTLAKPILPSKIQPDMGLQVQGCPEGCGIYFVAVNKCFIVCGRWFSRPFRHCVARIWTTSLSRSEPSFLLLLSANLDHVNEYLGILVCTQWGVQPSKGCETTQMTSASTGALGNRSRKGDTPKALAIGCGDVLTSWGGGKPRELNWSSLAGTWALIYYYYCMYMFVSDLLITVLEYSGSW